MGVNGLSMPVPFVNLELPLYTLFQNQMTVVGDHKICAENLWDKGLLAV